jgi:hypothetical protein
MTANIHDQTWPKPDADAPEQLPLEDIPSSAAHKECGPEADSGYGSNEANDATQSTQAPDGELVWVANPQPPDDTVSAETGPADQNVAENPRAAIFALKIYRVGQKRRLKHPNRIHVPVDRLAPQSHSLWLTRRTFFSLTVNLHPSSANAGPTY